MTSSPATPRPEAATAPSGLAGIIARPRLLGLLGAALAGVYLLTSGLWSLVPGLLGGGGGADVAYGLLNIVDAVVWVGICATALLLCVAGARLRSPFRSLASLPLLGALALLGTRALFGLLRAVVMLAWGAGGWDGPYSMLSTLRTVVIVVLTVALLAAFVVAALRTPAVPSSPQAAPAGPRPTRAAVALAVLLGVWGCAEALLPVVITIVNGADTTGSDAVFALPETAVAIRGLAEAGALLAGGLLLARARRPLSTAAWAGLGALWATSVVSTVLGAFGEAIGSDGGAVEVGTALLRALLGVVAALAAVLIVVLGLSRTGDSRP